MTWIDYKKTCDFTPHSWFNKCIELFGIADNVKNFLEKSMEEWKLLLMSNGEDFGKFDVKRGIFQGHSSSPLLFVLSTILLSLIFKKVNASYEWRKEKYKLNHFLFIDSLKLFFKNVEQIYTLVRTAHDFSADIGMESGMKKCGILTMKKRKLVRCEG